MGSILTCYSCGGKNVQVQAWVNANTNEYVSETDNGEAWCEDCEEHTKLKEIIVQDSDEDD